MYEHVTRFIEDIDAGTFDPAAFTHALYRPSIVDVDYRKTLEDYGLDRGVYRAADIESLDLRATIAVITFIHRKDRWNDGRTLESEVESGFLRRLLVRLRELDPDGGQQRKGIRMAQNENRPNVIGFFREYEDYGFCSNWYPSGFDFCGRHFHTVENWMMWQKARVMGDWAMAAKILA